eukprot:745930-Hanusia_phi.AAC.1
MFSAHGVPESYVEAGDPYKGQIERCAELIMESVNKGRKAEDKFDYTLCFQSRVGPVKWLEPYTDDVLKQLGEEGLKNLVVVPLSFVSEHVETLEEIDQEYREVAEEAGITNFKRVPALNSDPLFIQALVDITVGALNKPSLRVSETLELYQKSNDMPGYPWEFGVTRAAEQWNGRLAMLGIAALAVAQVRRRRLLWCEGLDLLVCCLCCSCCVASPITLFSRSACSLASSPRLIRFPYPHRHVGVQVWSLPDNQRSGYRGQGERQSCWLERERWKMMRKSTEKGTRMEDIADVHRRNRSVQRFLRMDGNGSSVIGFLLCNDTSLRDSDGVYTRDVADHVMFLR